MPAWLIQLSLGYLQQAGQVDRCDTVQLMRLCCTFVLQLRSRAIAAEGGASDAMAESAALEQQLDATKREVRPALLFTNSL